MGKMLSLDNRNFHGWGYRRKVVAEIERLMGLVKGEGEGEGVKASLAKEEFEYTTKMIGTNLSNFSAWHSRMRTIMRLLNEEKASDEKRREMLDKGRQHSSTNFVQVHKLSTNRYDCRTRPNPSSTDRSL